MNDKYELTNNTKEVNGIILYQIKALIDFSDVKKGDLGGYIEKEWNLSHSGNCWIYDEACVFGNTHVRGDARVSENACISGNVLIFNDACVSSNVSIFNGDEITDLICICDDAIINNLSDLDKFLDKFVNRKNSLNMNC